MTDAVPFTRMLVVFFTSMIPIFENKGSILLAATMRLTWPQAFFITSLGNFIPVAFFLHNKDRWLKRLHEVAWVNKSLSKVNGFLDKRKSSRRNSAVMLAVILSIPFTGVGGWIACVIVDILDIDAKQGAVAILVGILISGMTMIIFTYGIIAAGRAIFS